MVEPRQDKRYEQLQAALRDARNAAGYTQAELGARLGKDQVFVSKIESGVRQVDVVEFLDIAKALKKDPVAILRKVGEKD